MPAAQQFSVALDRSDPVVLLVAAGDVDASTVTDLSVALDGAITGHHRHVVLDANAITFIDSTGVSALMTAMRRLNRSRRRLAIACEAASPLGRALNMTGLDNTFELHPTADAAVAALAEAPLLGR